MWHSRGQVGIVGSNAAGDNKQQSKAIGYIGIESVFDVHLVGKGV